MTNELYYVPPTQKAFDEIKQKAIDIWKTYDDTFGYASEKIARVNRIENIENNYSVILAMFDSSNQFKHWMELTNGTRDEIRERLPDYMNMEFYSLPYRRREREKRRRFSGALRSGEPENPPGEGSGKYPTPYYNELQIHFH